ncbi:hypothetical protein GPL17_19950 [Bradyrhizobium yuanmingense]|uniref:hypothetical protein n=1 Tax=Bradyrhizobium yuanmingense TaxID=108015 RepID=UPI0012F93096|nr:hypothetical protein [Bradyrhizobium yuanmingense]MDF0578586.1 hypothetical protein [Bradyrhizobium yuanmingense]MVT52757.1 hypothetical protein [Bradyrhizobium yuanmingense]
MQAVAAVLTRSGRFDLNQRKPIGIAFLAVDEAFRAQKIQRYACGSPRDDCDE